jgi:hypothetical protein
LDDPDPPELEALAELVDTARVALRLAIELPPLLHKGDELAQ